MVHDPENNTVTIMGVKVEKTLSLGHISYFAVAAVTFLWLVFGYVGKIGTTADDLKRIDDKVTNFRAELLDRLITNQRTQTEQFQSLASAISNLPDMRAAVTQIEHRLDQADNRAAAQSNRLDTVQAQGVQSASDLTALLRAQTGNPRPGPR